jgi:hypothetical protein
VISRSSRAEFLHCRLVAFPALQTLHPGFHAGVPIEGDLAPLLEFAQPHEVAGVGYLGQRVLLGEVVAPLQPLLQFL